MGNFLLIIFGILSISIIVLMIFSPISRKIGVRNITRRLSNTFLVVIGAMVGTALITGSLILGDSLDATFYRLVEKELGEVDVTISLTQTSINKDLVFALNTDEFSNAKEQLLKINNVESVMGYLNYSVSPQKIENDKPVINAFQVNLTALNITDLNSFTKLNYVDVNSNEAIVSDTLAKNLELKEGDTIRVNLFSKNIDLKVLKIYEDKGFVGGSRIIINPNFLKDQYKLQSVGNNSIVVSHKGGISPENYDGEAFKTDIINGLKETSDRYDFNIVEQKQAALDGFGLGLFADLFVIFSTFGIFSGILLIINLYLMLASERKREMGILRAIALNRTQLIKIFTFEGFIYSILAAIVGTIFGIAVGYILVTVLAGLFVTAFTSIGAGATSNLQIIFGLTPNSLLIAFASGAVITILTSVFASYRVSKLNIVEAIRDTTDDLLEKFNLKWFLMTFLNFIMLAWSFGIFMFSFSISNIFNDLYKAENSPIKSLTQNQLSETINVTQAYLFYFGVILMILFGTFFITRLLNLLTKRSFTRLTVSIAALGSLIFTAFISNIDFIYKALDSNNGIGLFFVSSAVLVIALSMLVSQNLEIIIWIITAIFGRISSVRKIIKLPLRYTSINSSRTSLTLIMFSLIIFLIVFISVSKQLTTNQNQKALNGALGGYDVIIYPQNGSNSADSIVDTLKNKDYVENIQKITNIPIVMTDYKYKDLPSTQVQGGGPPQFTSRPGKPDDFYAATINAIPADYLINANLKLSEFLPEFKNEAEVWKALTENSDYIVLGSNFSSTQDIVPRPLINLGSEVNIADKFTKKVVKKKVIAKVEAASTIGLGLFNGIITSSSNAEKFFDTAYVEQTSNSNIVLSYKDNVDYSYAKNQLRKDLITSNVRFILSIEDLLGITQTFTSGLLGLIQGFLAFSLIIGSSGLAIILVRSVNERRQQIGMLRSLGFQSSEVLNIFFIEATFITTLSIIIGISMGLLGTYSIISAASNVESVDLEYTIPWVEIIILSGLVYLSSILFSILPSIKASKLSPVEATNYPE